MKIKPLKQPNDIACGPTCIYLADQYFGSSRSFKEIEKITNYRKTEGMSDKDIVKVLKQIGYKVERKINSDWEDLSKLNSKETVLIVSWMMEGYKGHVSIVDKVTKDCIFLVDSEEGKIIKMKKVQFMRLWMEYDDLWWPRTSKDINLRPLIVVKQK